MLSILKKLLTNRNSLVVFAMLIFFACQKNLGFEDNATASATPPDLTVKVNSSVSGFVTNESDATVMGATVKFGASTVTTDKYGFFELKNVQVVKQAAVVTIIKAGYFKAIKTYLVKEGNAAFFRIKLISKTNIGTVNAAAGGTVTLPNGLVVKLNAGTIVNAGTNAQYIGTVNVAAYWINPTSTDRDRIMPGDLRGINDDGAVKLLKTYGMAAVELTGSSGELLQIVNGQKATLTFPLPASLSASAPASIPLWYFNETNGLWKQEGTATKTGNSYVGDVGHFSFWNCDVPGNYVEFDCSLKSGPKNPLAYAVIKITVVGTNTFTYGYTNEFGYVTGFVPANSTLLMEALPGYGCSTALYSQTFTVTNANVSLGPTTIPAGNNIAILNGTVSNCNNTAVTNGFIIIREGSNFTKYPLDSVGNYSISKFFCTFPQTITLIGEDIINAQQSIFTSKIVNAGTNTIGNIQACGISTQQFVDYIINGVPYIYKSPTDTFSYFNDILSKITIGAARIPIFAYASLGFSNNAITAGSNQNLLFFYPVPINDSMSMNAPISVYISEYGDVDQFVQGTFSGTFTGQPPTNTFYNVTCNFRIRRRN